VSAPTPAPVAQPAPSAENQPLDFAGFVEALAAPATPPEASWRPVIARLAPDDAACFTAVCREHRLRVLDTMDRQLAELAMVRFPSVARRGERADYVERMGDPGVYGVWVYFPWSGTVAHLLDRDDYFAVVTDRNRDKITREEQHRLRSKRIGVLGLSVGGEAAVAVAQEHLCGQLVLADFDCLDLSNLNRLGGGADDLGLPKTTIIARRIARIDPYLLVTVLEEGVTADNADGFLDGLDLLVEECDGLVVKHDIRRRARARGLDVVYAADERGFLSVEPYRLYPDLAPFHGLIAEPPRTRADYPTPQAFMRALTEWLGGWDHISPRARASLEGIGETHSGYPQLAGEAHFAAAQVAHVARRLLLGERLPPFFGVLDLADLLPAATGGADAMSPGR
jgi:molybdopterin/thiamine biosynthesis adenylyltransferase